MALTASQKLSIKTLLGVADFHNYRGSGLPVSGMLDDVLAVLSAEQITEAESILTKWEEVRFSTGKLKGEYNDNPAETRALLRRQMSVVINFDPADYGIGGFPEIGRA